MKKIIILLLVGIITLTLFGCKECIDTQTQDVEVTIVDEYHRSSYITYIYTGKVMVPQSHPATYRITVKYDGKKYNVQGEETYYKFYERIGETVTGVLEIKTYDDGSKTYNIIDLK